MYNILSKDFEYASTSAVFFTNKNIFDNRGYFTVGFNKDAFNNEINSSFNIVQHNISSSSKNIVRGLHFQIDNNQAKVVHCLQGSVIDIIVDLRLNSPVFGKGKAYLLDTINTYLYVPHGFAHGFITLSDNAMFEYFVDDSWNKDSEYVLDFRDYLRNHNLYLFNNKNEIHMLNSYLGNIDNYVFSEKDIEKSQKYLETPESIEEFKKLITNKQGF